MARPMDFCIRNDKPVLVGQASCLPNLALQAGSLHHKRPNLIIPYAEVNKIGLDLADVKPLGRGVVPDREGLGEGRGEARHLARRARQAG